MNPDGTYKNPLFALYRDMAPPPNQNFVESGQVPTNNYYQGGIPNQVTAQNFGIRLDYNHSASDRFFFRASGTTFYEYNVDWTYETKYAGLHSNDKTRASWSYTGNWTQGHRVDGHRHAGRRQPLLRGPAAAGAPRVQAHGRRPAQLPGRLLPGARTTACCPPINVARLPGRLEQRRWRPRHHQPAGPEHADHGQGHAHAARRRRFRLAMRRGGLMTAGNVSSSYNFDTTYTRAADTTSVFPTNNIGPSLAALMLGHPDVGVDRRRTRRSR